MEGLRQQAWSWGQEGLTAQPEPAGLLAPQGLTHRGRGLKAARGVGPHVWCAVWQASIGCGWIPEPTGAGMGEPVALAPSAGTGQADMQSG